jgi:hypothetical protein
MNVNREEWVRDIGNQIPMLPLEDFATFLPYLTAEDIDSIRLKLEESGDILPQPDDEESEELESLWAKFPSPPSKSYKDSVSSNLPDDDVSPGSVEDLSRGYASGSRRKLKPALEKEQDVFKRLENICKAIKDACELALGRESNSTFRTDPDRTLRSNFNMNATFKVDGHETLDLTTGVEAPNPKKPAQFEESDVVWLTELRKLMNEKNEFEVYFYTFVAHHGTN